MLAVCALALPAGANAARIDAQDVEGGTVVTANFTLPAFPTNGLGGGYVSCPAGTNVFTGGAFVHPSAGTQEPTPEIFVRVSSTTPTSDGEGWYADGSNGTITPYTLRVEMICLPDALFAGRQILEQTVAMANDTTDADTVRCPQGLRAYTGGTYWATSGGGADPSTAADAWVSASTPNGRASAWYGAGRVFAPLDLHVMAQCLPANRLAPYEKQQLNLKTGGGEDRVVSGKCPASHPAAGPVGMFFHKRGKPPSVSVAHNTSLSNVGVFANPRRFYSGGRSIRNTKTLTARAFCLRG